MREERKLPTVVGFKYIIRRSIGDAAPIKFYKSSPLAWLYSLP